MNSFDTIAAIATPPGTGGVGIVRISGDDAENIISQLFCRNAAEMENRKMYFGTLKARDFCDNCMMAIFREPNSYTGETVAEVHCHGGRAITESVLQAVISCGARLAQNGEFTKRAFINGKVSLDESEAVVDMINAECKAEMVAAYNQMSGKLSGQVKTIQSQVMDMISGLEVAIDYPDEDVDFTNLKSQLSQVTEDIEKLKGSYSVGRLIKSGVNVAVVGLPNAGKSSLLNALVGYDRAIVTDIAGTTRDTVVESVEIGGVRFNLTDTAGIRKSQDIVEKIGVQRSLDAIKGADLVLFVTDGASRDNIGEQEIALQASGAPIIHVENKMDIAQFASKKLLCDGNISHITVSAKCNIGIDELKELMSLVVKVQNISERGVVIVSARHKDALDRAYTVAVRAIDSPDLQLDIAAFELKALWDILGEITGTTATEDIIDNIFSKFCLGK